MGLDKKIYSDVLDESGLQYVQLVQGGGGVLGVAMAGYLYVLESMGIRFLGLAGSSVGALNSLFIAVLDDIDKPKTELLIQNLVNKDFYDFVDGGAEAKAFVTALARKYSGLRQLWTSARILPSLLRNMGINPGLHFFDWVSEILVRNGIKTTADLLEKRKKLPKLRIRDGIQQDLSGLNASLHIIASDVTTESKVIFPQMADLYWQNPEQVNPAAYIRASMSVPVFFTPYRIKNIPKGEKAMQKWFDYVQFVGEIPQEVAFVDGGVMSNFPIAVFHKPKSVPRLPTFGVKFGVERNKVNATGNFLELAKALLDSAKQASDFDFIARNPDYHKLVKEIDVGHHDWLNFNLSPADKIDLFLRGAKAAKTFLTEFDWEQYKNIRSISLSISPS
jgi:NTE family protein